MRNPLVSIVMVNYNQEKYLKAAVDSVLSQTYQNWELIVVDDGSTDRSKEILNSYEDERIHPYFLEQNRHICYATNYGYARVQGEYLARLDSDDVWREEKLEKQVAFLEAHPEEQVVFTKLDIIDEDGKIINDKMSDLYGLYNSRQKNRRDWVRFFFYVGNSLIQSGMLMRTSLMRETGDFNLAYMQAHDFDYFVRLVKKTGFAFIEEPLTGYRRTESQNSAYHPEKDRRFFNEHMSIRRHFFDEFPDELFIEAFREEFVNPDSGTTEELQCEKAFLLAKCIGGSETNQVLGLEMFEELLKCPETRTLLEEKYAFTPREFYQRNAGHLYFQPQEEEHIRKMEQQIHDMNHHIQVLLDIKEQQQRHIEALESSLSWKVTKPLRTLKGIVKKA